MDIADLERELEALGGGTRTRRGHIQRVCATLVHTSSRAHPLSPLHPNEPTQFDSALVASEPASLFGACAASTLSSFAAGFDSAALFFGTRPSISALFGQGLATKLIDSVLGTAARSPPLSSESGEVTLQSSGAFLPQLLVTAWAVWPYDGRVEDLLKIGGISAPPAACCEHCVGDMLAEPSSSSGHSTRPTGPVSTAHSRTAVNPAGTQPSAPLRGATLNCAPRRYSNHAISPDPTPDLVAVRLECTPNAEAPLQGLIDVAMARILPSHTPVHYGSGDSSGSSPLSITGALSAAASATPRPTTCPSCSCSCCGPLPPSIFFRLTLVQPTRGGDTAQGGDMAAASAPMSYGALAPDQLFCTASVRVFSLGSRTGSVGATADGLPAIVSTLTLGGVVVAPAHPALAPASSATGPIYHAAAGKGRGPVRGTARVPLSASALAGSALEGGARFSTAQPVSHACAEHGAHPSPTHGSASTALQCRAASQWEAVAAALSAGMAAGGGSNGAEAHATLAGSEPHARSVVVAAATAARAPLGSGAPFYVSRARGRASAARQSRLDPASVVRNAMGGSTCTTLVAVQVVGAEQSQANALAQEEQDASPQQADGMAPFSSPLVQQQQLAAQRAVFQAFFPSDRTAVNGDSHAPTAPHSPPAVVVRAVRGQVCLPVPTATVGYSREELGRAAAAEAARLGWGAGEGVGAGDSPSIIALIEFDEWREAAAAHAEETRAQAVPADPLEKRIVPPDERNAPARLSLLAPATAPQQSLPNPLPPGPHQARTSASDGHDTSGGFTASVAAGMGVFGTAGGGPGRPQASASFQRGALGVGGSADAASASAAEALPGSSAPPEYPGPLLAPALTGRRPSVRPLAPASPSDVPLEGSSGVSGARALPGGSIDGHPAVIQHQQQAQGGPSLPVAAISPTAGWLVQVGEAVSSAATVAAFASEAAAAAPRPRYLVVPPPMPLFLPRVVLAAPVLPTVTSGSHELRDGHSLLPRDTNSINGGSARPTNINGGSSGGAVESGQREQCMMPPHSLAVSTDTVRATAAAVNASSSGSSDAVERTTREAAGTVALIRKLLRQAATEAPAAAVGPAPPSAGTCPSLFSASLALSARLEAARRALQAPPTLPSHAGIGAGGGGSDWRAWLAQRRGPHRPHHSQEHQAHEHHPQEQAAGAEATTAGWVTAVLRPAAAPSLQPVAGPSPPMGLPASAPLLQHPSDSPTRSTGTTGQTVSQQPLPSRTEAPPPQMQQLQLSPLLAQQAPSLIMQQLQPSPLLAQQAPSLIMQQQLQSSSVWVVLPALGELQPVLPAAGPEPPLAQPPLAKPPLAQPPIEHPAGSIAAAPPPPVSNPVLPPPLPPAAEAAAAGAYAGTGEAGEGAGESAATAPLRMERQGPPVSRREWSDPLPDSAASPHPEPSLEVAGNRLGSVASLASPTTAALPTGLYFEADSLDGGASRSSVPSTDSAKRENAGDAHPAYISHAFAVGASPHGSGLFQRAVQVALGPHHPLDTLAASAEDRSYPRTTLPSAITATAGRPYSPGALHTDVEGASPPRRTTKQAEHRLKGPEHRQEDPGHPWGVPEHRVWGPEPAMATARSISAPPSPPRRRSWGSSHTSAAASTAPPIGWVMPSHRSSSILDSPPFTQREEQPPGAERPVLGAQNHANGIGVREGGAELDVDAELAKEVWTQMTMGNVAPQPPPRLVRARSLTTGVSASQQEPARHTIALQPGPPPSVSSGETATGSLPRQGAGVWGAVRPRQQAPAPAPRRGYYVPSPGEVVPVPRWARDPISGAPGPFSAAVAAATAEDAPSATRVGAPAPRASSAPRLRLISQDLLVSSAAAAPGEAAHVLFPTLRARAAVRAPSAPPVSSAPGPATPADRAVARLQQRVGVLRRELRSAEQGVLEMRGSLEEARSQARLVPLLRSVAERMRGRAAQAAS